MPQTLSPQIVLQKPADLPRLCWSADKYESLFAMDLLTHGKYELIAGDIVEKMALRYTHAQIITLLFAFFSRFCSFPLLGSAFTLAASDTSMPEPDFAVFATETPTLTERGYVRPGDVRLVVEVSDATLPHDTTEKVTLYARAGIAEY